VQILLVDDDPLELFLSLKIIRTQYKADGFKTLPEAIEWAKANPFDILLSDYYLDKQISAHDVLKALHDLKGNTFKSYVLTNYIDETKKAELRELGFDGIIEKPMAIDKLKSAAGIQ